MTSIWVHMIVPVSGTFQEAAAATNLEVESLELSMGMSTLDKPEMLGPGYKIMAIYGKPMVYSPLIRPHFLGGWHWWGSS